VVAPLGVEGLTFSPIVGFTIKRGTLSWFHGDHIYMCRLDSTLTGMMQAITWIAGLAEALNKQVIALFMVSPPNSEMVLCLLPSILFTSHRSLR